MGAGASAAYVITKILEEQISQPDVVLKYAGNPAAGCGNVCKKQYIPPASLASKCAFHNYGSYP
jgi:hypothetical protein